ncbi:hypothetical protein [Fimbriimonas ginsengisoli]|uniref:Uncharacterized protein n=1 Tax=Fimbriimonas ginsengisoli Gsoil 348 TaxID=661478 RepID=A0A068NVH6_FIMGI|nr:hypothetical protein [Fimbriimonas ginsengisoli]AIE85554.1 hypothetical protein OP10G_2186 [Fimbriimonas ginsengisoli Gsoil 348]
MHTNEPREDPLVELGYEIRDVDYPKTRKAIIYFLSFGAFCAVVGWFIYANRFWIFRVTDTRVGPHEALARRIPQDPNPLLQDNVGSKVDISDFRKEESAKLNTTGYMDKALTRVHIPIDRAIDLIAQRGIVPTNRTVPAVSKGNTTNQNQMPTGVQTQTPTEKPGQPGVPGIVQPPAPLGGGTSSEGIVHLSSPNGSPKTAPKRAGQ